MAEKIKIKGDEKIEIEEVKEEEIKEIEKAIEVLQEKETVKTIEIDSRGRVKREYNEKEERQKRLEGWVPLTRTGRMVKNNELTGLEQIREAGLSIMEPETIDLLLPELEEKMVQLNKTTRVTASGRNFSFRATTLIGDKNGHIGIGTGKDRERQPAIRKAARDAKLNIVSVNRSCGSWECSCHSRHSVPFKVSGKAGSLRVLLMPAPKGIGLIVGEAIKPVMELAGIKDVWAYTKGRSKTTLNFLRAAIDALSQTNKMKINKDFTAKLERSGKE